MNKREEKCFEMIKKEIMNLCEIQEEKYKITKEYVKSIIKTECTDIKTIEHVFDQILDLAYFKGEDIRPLCDELAQYYSKINKEYSDEYVSMFNEIINEEI